MKILVIIISLQIINSQIIDQFNTSLQYEPNDGEETENQASLNNTFIDEFDNTTTFNNTNQTHIIKQSIIQIIDIFTSNINAEKNQIQRQKNYLPEQQIPMTLYQTFYTHKLYQNQIQNVMQWLTMNPYLEYYLRNDEEIQQFFHQNFDTKFNKMLKSLKLQIMRVDLYKLCVLYIRGGIYSDIDIKPLKPIDRWDLYPFDKYQVVIGKEVNQWHFETRTMMSVPRHPLFKYIIEYVYDSLVMNRIDYGEMETVHISTGSTIISKAIRSFLGISYQQPASIIMEILQMSNNKNSSIHAICKQYKIKFVDDKYFSTIQTAHEQFDDVCAKSWMKQRDILNNGGNIKFSPLNVSQEVQIYEDYNYLHYFFVESMNKQMQEYKQINISIQQKRNEMFQQIQQIRNEIQQLNSDTDNMLQQYENLKLDNEIQLIYYWDLVQEGVLQTAQNDELVSNIVGLEGEPIKILEEISLNLIENDKYNQIQTKILESQNLYENNLNNLEKQQEQLNFTVQLPQEDLKKNFEIKKINQNLQIQLQFYYQIKTIGGVITVILTIVIIMQVRRRVVTSYKLYDSVVDISQTPPLQQPGSEVDISQPNNDKDQNIELQQISTKS